MRNVNDSYAFTVTPHRQQNADGPLCLLHGGWIALFCICEKSLG